MGKIKKIIIWIYILNVLFYIGYIVDSGVKIYFFMNLKFLEIFISNPLILFGGIY